MADHDVLILGAGASGLVCALHAAARGRRVALLDHAEECGRKVSVTGGGRCNFTNLGASAGDYACANPHFVKSALAQYTPHDFTDSLRRGGLPVHDEGHGRLFSDKAADVAAWLTREALSMGAEFLGGLTIRSASPEGGEFRVDTDQGSFRAASLVLALGGLAWPRIGATNLGYALARGLGLASTPLRPGLVPLLAGPDLLPLCRELAGLSLPVEIAAPHKVRGEMLFTHRGLSGPAVLDASLAWREGQTLAIDLLPAIDLPAALAENPRRTVRGALSRLLPKRLAASLCAREKLDGEVANLSRKRLAALEETLHAFPFAPSATAGYAKAEVTLGGVDVSKISSKTMAAKAAPGLHVIGELLDVTGRLGGYNLQWAWSSGYVAGQWA